MSRVLRCLAAEALALFAAIALAPEAQAASIVTLDVPQLANAGSARSFEFVSFQFNLYLVPIGDPVSDFSANVLANDYENYTYVRAVGGGSGKGGGYHPPTYARGPGDTYSDTYQNVTSPPTKLDALFHFSGADVAGMPLAVTVSDSGTYSLNLTADADGTHSPITPGTPLSNSLYTLEYQTNSLLGSQITFVSAVALPGDYNNDGVVDAADYAVWRDNLGAPAGTLPNDVDGSVIGQAQYDTWKANFGRMSGVGSQSNAAVPEPASRLLILLGAVCVALETGRRRIRTRYRV
jgi:hypothetical protein